MLPTFVIGLREGVEATLIVGIVAAFLRQRGAPRHAAQHLAGRGPGRGDLPGRGRSPCDVLNSELPQRQQEMLETVVGVLAVGVVTFMIFWMRRHARGLKRRAARPARPAALATGSAAALVAMAFFAVLREGLETAVFLLAVFQDAERPHRRRRSAPLLGVARRRGHRLSASTAAACASTCARFFRVTSVVLVLVAAGLLATRRPHRLGGRLDHLLPEPGRWTSPGSSCRARGPRSLLTGMLGLQPHPSVAQIAGYLAYAVPMLAYVLWPAGGARRTRGPRSAGAVRRPHHRLQPDQGAAALTPSAVPPASWPPAPARWRSAWRRAAATTPPRAARRQEARGRPERQGVRAGATSRPRPARPRSRSRTRASGKVTEIEMLKGAPDPGRAREHREGLDLEFSLNLKPGTYDISCPNGPTTTRRAS